MSTATLIGIDLDKHRFHLHAHKKAGGMVLRKRLMHGQRLAQRTNQTRRIFF